MKKPIIISLCILMFGLALVFLFMVFSDCSSIPWIHQLQYKWSGRKFEKKKDKMFSLLPQNVRESIDQDDEYMTLSNINNAVVTGIPDEVQRAVVIFRILGLDDLMLAGGSGWTSSFSKILDPIPISAKIKAFTIVQNEPQALKAASWWLFKHLSLIGYDDAYKKIPEEHLKVALPVATSYAMANWPRHETRIAIKILSKMEGQTAKTLLLKYLASETSP